MTESFDPLGVADPQFLVSAIKQRVRNIIRSYNHPTDLLSEPIQNAVDEVEQAVHDKAIERGAVLVTIDCSTAKITVEDNGRGISTQSIRSLLAPDVTGKAELFRSGRSRGHKGVGLTFLAYGFNFFEIESRTETEHYKVRIDNARQWIEDSANTTVPQAEMTLLGDDEGILTKPGTVVTVQVSDQTEPRNLNRSFPTPEFAQTVIESQTAIGVFPKKATHESASFDAQLDYRRQDGGLKSFALETSYRFPHLKLKTGAKTIDVGHYLASNPATTVPPRLTKKHEAGYRHYSTDQLVSLLKGKAEGDLLTSDAEVEAMLRKHEVTAYGLAGYGAPFKETLATSWSIPVNRKLIAPSIRVATDGMISSWQRDLSLSHRGFNVERIWLLVHLIGVEPDLGRKDYPPEILELLTMLEDPIANDVAAQAEPFLIPSSRSGKPIEYDAPAAKVAERRKTDLSVQLGDPFGSLAYGSEPKEEQDVIALFNELRGRGVLDYFTPVFFSGSYVYDAYFEYHPDVVPAEITAVAPSNTGSIPKRKWEGIAEFKFDPFDLLDDIVRELKSWNEMRWIVCWDAPTVAKTKTRGGETMTVTPADPGDGVYAGVTHIANLDSAGETELYVLALKPLLLRLAKEKDATP